MNDVDNRVVQMEFDNVQFQKGVAETIKSLESLEKALQLQGASQGLDEVSKAAPKTAKALGSISEAAEQIEVSFSAAEVIMATVLARMTNLALTTGKKMASALWKPIIEGGRNRALNIEAAKFQLEGLDVAWGDIADDINYAVQGTAFGLDEAAKVASQLVASQVALGEEMKYSLRGISGVAAMTNSTYSEIGNIFATVAANGKLMTMQLRQLSARGLNASAQLAKTLNKTEEEINDMVSKGLISFDTFAKAMDDAFGEHAKDANKTFTGALSNMKAALARLGEAFATPTLEALKDTFNTIKNLVDGIKRSMTPIIESYTGITKMASMWTTDLIGSEDTLDAISELIISIYTWIRPLIGAFMDFVNTKRSLDGFHTSLGDFFHSLQLYGENAYKVKNIFTAMFNAIDIFVTGLKAVATILKPIITVVAEMFGVSLDKADGIADWINKNTPKIERVINMLAYFMSLGVEEILTDIKNVVGQITLTDIIKAVRIIFTILAVGVKILFTLGKIAGTVIKVVSGGIAFIAAGIIWLVNALITAPANIANAIGRAVDWVTNKISYLMNLVVEGAGVIGNFVSSIFGRGSTTTTVRVDTSGMESSESIQATSEALDEVTESSEKATSAVKSTARAVRSASKDIVSAKEDEEEAFDSMTQSANTMNSALRDAADKAEESSKSIGDSWKALSEEQKNVLEDQAEMYDNAKEKDKEYTREVVNEFERRIDEIKKAKDNDRLFGENNEEDSRPIENFFNTLIDAFNLGGTNFGIVLENIGTGVQEAVTRLKKVIRTAVTSLTDEIFSVLEDVLGYIEEHTGTIMKIFGWWALYQLYTFVDAIIGFVGALGNAARGFRAQAVAKELWAFAGVVAVIGTVLIIVMAMADTVNIEQFDKLEQIIARFIKTTFMIYALIEAIGALKALFEMITQFKKGATLKIDTKPSEGVAATILSMVAAVLVISNAMQVLGKAWQEDQDSIVKGIWLVAGIMTSLIVFVLVMGGLIKGFNLAGSSETNIDFTWFGSPKSMTYESNSPLGRLVMMIGMLSLAVLVISYAVIELGKQPYDILIKGMGYISGIFAILMGFIALMGIVSKKIHKVSIYGETSDEQSVASIINNLSNSLIKLVVALAGLTAVIWILDKIPTNEYYKGLDRLLQIMVAISAFMVVIAFAQKLAGKWSNSLDTSYMKEIRKTMLTFALSILGIVVVLGILSNSGMNPDILWKAAILVGAVAVALAGILLAISAVTKTFLDSKSTVKMKTLQEMKELVFHIALSVGIMMLAIAGMATILSNANEAGIAAALGTLTLIVLLIAITCSVFALFIDKVKASQLKQFEKLMWNVLGSISVLMVAIGAMFLMMSAIDWSSAGTIMGALGVTIGLIVAVAVIMGLFAKLITPKKMVTALIGIAGIDSLLLAIGAMFWMLSNVDWDSMEKAIPYLLGTIIFVGVLAILMGILGAMSKGVVPGVIAAFFFSIAAMFVAIGAAALMIGVSVRIIVDALNALGQIDATNAISACNALMACIEVLANVGLKALFVAMILPAIAVAIGAAALIISTLAFIDPSMFAQAGVALQAFFDMLNETIVQNSDLVGALMLFIIVFPLLGAAILIGSAALLASAVIIFGFIMVLSVICDFVPTVAETIKTGFQSLIDTFTTIGSMVFDNIWQLVVAASSLVVFATLLGIAGAFLIVGGGIMMLGASLLVISSVLLKFGVETMLSTTEMLTASNIFETFLNLIGLALALAGGGLAMIIGGGLFALGAGIFLKGSKNFKNACNFFAQGMEALEDATDAFFDIVDEWHEHLQNFFNMFTGGSSSGGFDWSYAGTSIITGLTEGLESAASEAWDEITSIADGIVSSFCEVLDIHSPSEVFRALGLDTLAGFCEAIENGQSPMEALMSATGLDATDSFLSNLNLEDGVEGILNSFLSMLGIDLNQITDMMGAAGFDAGDSYSTSMLNGMNRGVLALKNQREELVRLMTSYASSSSASDQARAAELRKEISQMDQFIAGYEAAVGANGGYGEINPNDYKVSSSSGGYSGGGLDTATSSALASQIAGSSGAGSGINDTSKSYGVGNTINSNNTYNYIQNNYSPEPLTRSEIYDATQEQLRNWRGYELTLANSL